MDGLLHQVSSPLERGPWRCVPVYRERVAVRGSRIGGRASRPHDREAPAAVERFTARYCLVEPGVTLSALVFFFMVKAVTLAYSW